MSYDDRLTAIEQAIAELARHMIGALYDTERPEQAEQAARIYKQFASEGRRGRFEVAE